MSELVRDDQPAPPVQRAPRPGAIGGVSVAEPTGGDPPGRWSRRSLIAGVAGVGAASAAGALAIRHWAGGDGGEQPLARQGPERSGASGFANRDESYALSGERISAETAPPPILEFATAGEAAAATAVTVPTILDTTDPAVHLLRRATFGPTPESLAEVHAGGIDGWLATQLDPTSIADPEGDLAWAAFPLASADPPTVRARIERGRWDAGDQVGLATFARQMWSRRQLYEVMVDFWANHLNVPTPGPGSWDVGGSYQRDVIRANALGSFTDMLLGAGRHPAMLRYLTAEQSKKDSVNENYGRELLELHTVGVASGFTEDDVRNSAYILTGRTVVPRDEPDEGAFRYDAGRHWVGPVQVLDFADPNGTADGGLDVGDAYLRHLAAHPATAQTIARKLAVRFVSDTPPTSLVDRMAARYLDGGTEVAPMLDTLFRSAEFWASVGQKTRRPAENIAASVRILGAYPEGDIDHSVTGLANTARRAGHRPLAWLAPNGYADVYPAWRSVIGLVECWNVHRSLLGDWEDRLSRPDPFALAGGATTVGDFVGNLCRRLCFQVFRTDHRDALVAFLGGDPVAAVRRELAEPAAALVLDSPYFTLR